MAMCVVSDANRCQTSGKLRFTSRSQAKKYGKILGRKHSCRFKAYKCDLCSSCHLCTAYDSKAARLAANRKKAS